jgi:hypothetical protein
MRFNVFKILTQIKGISVNECILKVIVSVRMDVDSSVEIATCYGMDGSGIESRWRPDFPAPAHTGPGSIQPSVQWVAGLFSGGKAAGEWY